MYLISGQVWVLVAGITAGAAGFFFNAGVRNVLDRRARGQKIRQNILGVEGLKFEDTKTVTRGFTGLVLKFLVAQSRIVKMQPGKKFFAQGVWKLGVKKYALTAKKSGLDAYINLEGFYHARALLSLMGGFGGALLGVVFSGEFAAVGFLGGFLGGWCMPIWALRQESSARKNDLESHLSEMLEVVSLGLRSGLSFDRSFELYHLHFSTQLGHESAVAQRQWQIGLKTREESLRELVATYDSSVFGRVVENVIRSLRFGSSLADSFDFSALEARVLRKARREEEVAKAPVKMLIPTAALILPAMLLLVLGPVLLDMMQGF